MCARAGTSCTCSGTLITAEDEGVPALGYVVSYVELCRVLRERLGLPGSKGACEQGECGSCTVVIDNRAVCSCLVLAASAVGRDVATVEGLNPDGSLTDVQQAFVDEGAVQCGFCTPGLVVAVHGLQIGRAHV
mgnify:CR=1 FL=1